MKRKVGVDIIIPVYNAPDDLKQCMESVVKHTDLSVDRVLLIDDKSPDPAVDGYLSGVKTSGIVVLRNEKNLGFSGTVNRGIQYSDRDVILLNSDTIVTAGWVDKLVACAYSDRSIGTVTPFSNNATLCSIPNFCQENEVPYGLSIDEYARVIERSSMREYPRITVAVGFCMLIKRELIDTIGLFDRETFQKGYGEENDFCWRAEQVGYYHALCDDTYIYHSGTVSFLSEEKKALIAEHQEILKKRYPVQEKKNVQFVHDNPHQYLRTNVDFYAKLKNGKRNILYVLHRDFRVDAKNNIGGTQFHVKDLTDHLRAENNVFVLVRDEDHLRLTVYTESEQFSFSFYIGEEAQFQSFYHQDIEKALRQILAAFEIDLIHVHHVQGLSFDVFDVAKEMGIPLVLTLHDYFYICPSVVLLEKGTTYCGLRSENCSECLRTLKGYAQEAPIFSVWQKTCRRILLDCDGLIAPSAAAAEVYALAYPELGERIRVIPHGMDDFAVASTVWPKGGDVELKFGLEHIFEGNYRISGWAYLEGIDSRTSEMFIRIEDKDGKATEYRLVVSGRKDVAEIYSDERYLYSGFSFRVPDGHFATGNLSVQLKIRNQGKEYFSRVTTVKGYVRREKKRPRIAFLGGLSESKGANIAYDLINHSGKFDWYIIGGIGDYRLRALEKRNLFKNGWYNREDVGAILKQNQIDLICIFSIWPETFCYTASEAQVSGIPILAMDMGAPGLRIREEKTGWLIGAEASIPEILSRIEEIIGDEENYGRVKAYTEAFEHRSISDMCAEYAECYRELPLPEDRTREFDPRVIYNAYCLCQTEEGGRGMFTDMSLLRRVKELEGRLRVINSSMEYKALKFLGKSKIPFKRQLKGLLKFAYRVYKRFVR